MNDIYKQKAKKYKYKYIKLKKKIEEIEGGQISLQKYVVQGLKNNEWIDIPDKQIKLINSSELNEYKYIYDDIKHEIINIKNNKRQECLLLNLPKHNGAKSNKKININIINSIINTNNNKPTVIDNKYIIKDFHNLYYIQSDVINEWNNSEEWQKNILPLLYNENNIQNTIILKFLPISTEYYLLFIYNETKYISFIFISEIEENSVQFIIVNLDTGDSRIIYYPLLIYQKKKIIFWQN